MKILLFVISTLVSQSLAGVLYHRQHAAAVQAGHHPLSGRGNEDYHYSNNQIFGSGLFGYDEPDESVRVIKITRTYAVPVPVPVPYPKEVPIPVAVPKPVPVPVPHPVPVPVHKAIVIPHPVAVPVPIDHLSPPSEDQDSHYQDLQQYPTQTGSSYSQRDEQYHQH
ncbi:cyclin-dependent kinase inhibitor 1C-like [Cimex lectularius]|uniref:CPR type cuticle protein n=1 Tax=Cimex lectularius TaxID=79782 RepID=A0A8I6S5G1_CIMLE|nr:cyclin-dependent kinase inhibitor 1C-like [Cimex lectularius]